MDYWGMLCNLLIIVSFQRVVIILHGKKPQKADMDEDLKKYFKTNSYIESRDPQFWNKLS